MSSIEGKSIRRRKFEPSQSATLRFSGEHLSSSPYTMKYSQKNVNSIRHLLNEQINSVGLWEADLRNHEMKEHEKTFEIKKTKKEKLITNKFKQINNINK
jgi:hypothetical protein